MLILSENHRQALYRERLLDKFMRLLVKLLIQPYRFHTFLLVVKYDRDISQRS
jgi:hypothetical protein